MYFSTEVRVSSKICAALRSSSVGPGARVLPLAPRLDCFGLLAGTIPNVLVVVAIGGAARVPSALFFR